MTLHVYGLVHEKRYQKAKAIALELASRWVAPLQVLVTATERGRVGMLHAGTQR